MGHPGLDLTHGVTGSDAFRTICRSVDPFPGEWSVAFRVTSYQGERCLRMELRITSSFRIQAVRATFFGLPAASSRWYMKRLAVNAPM